MPPTTEVVGGRVIPQLVLRILVAEDDRGVQTLLQTLLTREGYAVECANDGMEAIQRVAATSYDVILLDLAMPKASGQDVLAALERAGRRDVLSRIIVVTAASSKEVAAIRNAPVIRKPFDLSDLRAAIRRVVADRPVGPNLERPQHQV